MFPSTLLVIKQQMDHSFHFEERMQRRTELRLSATRNEGGRIKGNKASYLSDGKNVNDLKNSHLKHFKFHHLSYFPWLSLLSPT